MIKAKEIQRVAHSLLPAFPGWRFLKSESLVRENGPILQGLWLRRVTFCEAFGINAFLTEMIAPYESLGFCNVQDVKNRNGSPERMFHLRDFEKERDEIIAEIFKQLGTRVTQVLGPREFLKIAGPRAHLNSRHACSMAAVHAWLGRRKEALRWCAESRKRAAELAAAVGEKADLTDPFVGTLERWIEAGDVRQHLEKALAEQRRRLGLAG